MRSLLHNFYKTIGIKDIIPSIKKVMLIGMRISFIKDKGCILCDTIAVSRKKQRGRAKLMLLSRHTLALLCSVRYSLKV